MRNLSYRAELLGMRTSRPKELPANYLNTLIHLRKGGIVSGWDRWYDEMIMDLEAWGLIRGTWIGSLDREPSPFWDLTKTGQYEAS